MHTPGPWKITRADTAYARTYVRAGDTSIVECLRVKNTWTDEADNARLIAAAPAMLEAIQNHLKDPCNPRLAHELRAVVALATGKEMT